MKKRCSFVHQVGTPLHHKLPCPQKSLPPTSPKRTSHNFSHCQSFLGDLKPCVLHQEKPQLYRYTIWCSSQLPLQLLLNRSFQSLGERTHNIKLRTINKTAKDVTHTQTETSRSCNSVLQLKVHNYSTDGLLALVSKYELTHFGLYLLSASFCFHDCFVSDELNNIYKKKLICFDMHRFFGMIDMHMFISSCRLISVYVLVWCFVLTNLVDNLCSHVRVLLYLCCLHYHQQSKF